MSAKGRGSAVMEKEQYPTPPWITYMLWKKLAEHDLAINGPKFFEPCAGSGSIVKATNYAMTKLGLFEPSWAANEIDHKYEQELLALKCNNTGFHNYLELPTLETKYDLIITNPPFSLAEDFIIKACQEAKTVAMLLRINFLGTKRRVPFFQKVGLPTLYVSPKRPSFIKGTTDATEYAWFVWDTEANSPTWGGYYMLDFPTKEELKELNTI